MIARKRLGAQGLEVSAIGLGCMGMSVFYGPSDDERSERAILAALDRGVDFLDSADFYGDGHGERLLRRVLEHRPERVALSIKSGLRVLPEGGLSPPDGRPEHVRTACEASLRRLGAETIDLYSHARVDPGVPIEETIGAMARLVDEGKIRFVGLSEAGAETVRRAHAEHPISVLQLEYSLFAREPAESMRSVCDELGVGLVASCPLGRGILGGHIRTPGDVAAPSDIRGGMPWYQPGNFAANRSLVDELETLAADLGASPAQLAIAWLCQRGVVPIPGSRHPDRVAENVSAVAINLAEADLRRIEAVVAPGRVSGERRKPEQMQEVGV